MDFSSEVARGTTFRVSLPLSRCPRITFRTAPAADEPPIAPNRAAWHPFGPGSPHRLPGGASQVGMNRTLCGGGRPRAVQSVVGKLEAIGENWWYNFNVVVRRALSSFCSTPMFIG